MRPSTPLAVRRSLQQVADDLATWRKLRGVSLENVLRVLRGLGVIEGVTRALDPYESDIGRLRADELLPRRVRPKRLNGEG